MAVLPVKARCLLRLLFFPFFLLFLLLAWLPFRLAVELTRTKSRASASPHHHGDPAASPALSRTRIAFFHPYW